MPTRTTANARRPDLDLLRMALLEQEGNTQPGRVPSGMAMNAYLAEMPETFEQGREADILGEMDRRYYQSREDDRKRRGAVEDAKALASVRDFQTRTGVEDQSVLADSPMPGAVRTIRRFGDSSKPTDSDAARSARQVALDDPRVLAAAADAGTRPNPGQAATDKAALKAKEKAETNVEIARLANELRTSPALNRNVGPLDEWIPTMRGDSKEFEAKVQRLKDLLALEARTKLEGQGAVSDFEGKMIANSTSALRLGTDEQSFRDELDRIIGQANKTSGVRRFNPTTGQLD